MAQLTVETYFKLVGHLQKKREVTFPGFQPSPKSKQFYTFLSKKASEICDFN